MKKIFLLWFVAFFGFIGFSFTQTLPPIIINESSQGSNHGTSGTDEWIELVVTADSTDINGMYLDTDNKTNTLGNAISLQFRSDLPELGHCPMGTIIVIYNGGTTKDPNLPADDVVFGRAGTANNPTGTDDWTLLIPSTNTSFLSTATNTPSWKTSKRTGDAIGIFQKPSPTNVGIMGISWGTGVNNTIVGAQFPANSFVTGLPGLTYVDQGFGFTSNTNVTSLLNWQIEEENTSVYPLPTPKTLNGGQNSLLPVELTSFNAIYLNSAVNLDWRTETEVKNYGFEIQRAEINSNSDLNNPNFSKIGFVKGHGNSNSPKEYSFVDNEVSTGKYLYRLKQIDIDGKYEYSKNVEINAGDIPQNFVLEQNYPNPFNPTTTIKFGFQKNSFASLKVYNAIGQQVAELFNGNADAGRIYNVKFDGTDLSSGMYFYKLQSDNKTVIKKMLLLK